MTDETFSEKFRLAAIEYVKAEAIASLKEELKSATLSQMMQKLGDIAVNKAERDVKASKEWSDYIENMVELRKQANEAKYKVEVAKMEFNEWQSQQATARAEMRL